MGTRKLCVCDRTRQCLISAEIDLLDTVQQPLATIVNDISGITQGGLWLNPFRGIPRGPRLSRFDVIYLDEECRVLDCVENFAVAEFVPIDRQAASALLLPAHTLNASHIHTGDRFRVCKEKHVLAPADDASMSSVDENALPCPRESGAVVSQMPKHAHEAKAIEADAAQCEVIEDNPSPVLRFLRWLFPAPAPSDRRRGERLPAPGLVVYHWTGGAPQSYQVADVSQSGLYLLTEERWLPGTRIVMTLQREDGSESIPADIHRVESEIVRWGADGVGCAFVESGFVDLNSGEIVEDQKFDREAFQQFLHRVQNPASRARRSTVQ